MCGIAFLIVSHKQFFDILRFLEKNWKKPYFGEIGRKSAGNMFSANCLSFQISPRYRRVSGECFWWLVVHVSFWSWPNLVLWFGFLEIWIFAIFHIFRPICLMTANAKNDSFLAINLISLQNAFQKPLSVGLRWDRSMMEMRDGLTNPTPENEHWRPVEPENVGYPSKTRVFLLFFEKVFSFGSRSAPPVARYI